MAEKEQAPHPLVANGETRSDEESGAGAGAAQTKDLNKKKRKTAEDKERLEWYDIPKDYDPEECDLEWLQEDVEDLWQEIKNEMSTENSCKEN